MFFNAKQIKKSISILHIRKNLCMTIRPKVSFVFLIFYFPLLLFSFAVVLSIEKGVFLFFSTHVDFYVVQMSAWCEGRACLDQWYYSGHRISFSIRRWMPSMRRELNDHVLWLWAFQFDTALKIDIFVWGRKSNDNLSKKRSRASQVLIFHF